jgi:hypothetical protein
MKTRRKLSHVYMVSRITHPEQHPPPASSSSTPPSDRARRFPFFFESPSSAGGAIGRIDKCMIVVAYGLSLPSSWSGFGMCVGSLSSASKVELVQTQRQARLPH